jgi:UDP-N-acetylmuramyl pentapeptide phosphotransferase/UDP-N-acetylglucosamine-1-phosphate transferase
MDWLLLHFAIGLVGTWLAMRYALRRNLLDQPGERRSHAVPTPRGGGIAIVVALLLAGIWWLQRAGGEWPVLAAFLVGLLLVAVVGLIDDHRPLSPWLRLAVHFVAAALLAVGAWLTYRQVLPAFLVFGLALVLTNVWNFMDGIDGLAASQAALVAVAVAWSTTGLWQSLALTLLAATIGFLPFNFPKARIFLGDVGSGALGFTLASLLIGTITQSPRTWGLWMLPLSAFLLDAGLTLLGRLRRGEAWWRPHILHAYQRWARVGGSHIPVTLGYAAWTALAVLLSLALRGTDPLLMTLYCVAWYVAGAGVWWVLQRKGIGAGMENME